MSSFIFRYWEWGEGFVALVCRVTPEKTALSFSPADGPLPALLVLRGSQQLAEYLVQAACQHLSAWSHSLHANLVSSCLSSWSVVCIFKKFIGTSCSGSNFWHLVSKSCLEPLSSILQTIAKKQRMSAKKKKKRYSHKNVFSSYYGNYWVSVQVCTEGTGFPCCSLDSPQMSSLPGTGREWALEYRLSSFSCFLVFPF